MKLALIPPIPELRYDEPKRNYHLMLPQLVGDKDYAKKYKVLCESNFVMMDNGAAEGLMLSDKELLDLAHEFKPAELVLPDIIADALGTIEVIRGFLSTRRTLAGIDFMAVAQGRSIIEVKRMIEVVAEIDRVATIGLPRHLVKTLRSNAARLDMARWIQKKYQKRFAIHLLGAAPQWPGELFFARELGFVRGMDTSMPFNYALRGLILSDDYRNVTRPDNYFSTEFNAEQNILARRNVSAMNQWASGEVHTSDRIPRV